MGDSRQDHPPRVKELLINKEVNSNLIWTYAIKPKVTNILMCSERTLEAWRREEGYYYKIEGKILYKLDDILSFIESSKYLLSKQIK